ncbi:hypothetical protein GS451_07035 [Rhodococcus hoagii]|nr:hypothetical protein [Prescottella equi]NKV87966.1 hypothetical protein [Prescottella equi]
MADETSQLQEYLEHRLGRRVSIEELLDATGLTRSTFYRRKKSGFDEMDILNAAEFFSLKFLDMFQDLKTGRWRDETLQYAEPSSRADRTDKAMKDSAGETDSDRGIHDEHLWSAAVYEWLDALAPLIDALPSKSRARTMSEVVAFLNDAIRADRDRFRPAAREIGRRLTSAPDFSNYQAASRGDIDPEDHPEH